jgi:hydroxymethylpyrimidine/phosphomethylpyrimidine kinase
MTPPRVLIIAGSDSGGGAGIQADIKTVTMFGGYAMTAITAITVQNTLGVDEVMPIETEMVIKQIDAVVDDIGVDAVKIGMIGAAETAAALADRLSDIGAPIVFDPVMIATSGSRLADGPTIAAFERLLAIATLATPNLPELEVLSGRRMRGEDDIVDATLALHRRYGCAVLAKGGHGGGPVVTDLLARGGTIVRRDSERLNTADTHGTGCTLASAAAAGLGAGQSLDRAVQDALIYVHAALRAAPGYGEGHGPIGHTLGLVPWESIHKKSRR